ncbi:MAG TPA: hypothetical protein VMW35_21935 [Myxococcota bacterium]|nr:hypothetical protein [Myxococcota bacterium]
MLRRALANVALLLGTLALLVGVGEIVLRLFPDVTTFLAARDARGEGSFNPFQPDGLLGYALRPGAVAHQELGGHVTEVRVNALGLRGPEASPRPTPGRPRVLVLGDSFAFGFGVAEGSTLRDRLEASLRARGVDAEVLSAGVPGWSTDHQLVYLRSRGFALEPALVLLVVCENDPSDLAWNRLTLDDARLPTRIETTRRMIDPGGRLRYVNAGRTALPGVGFPAKAWLEDHSRVYHWLRFRLVKAETALRARGARAEAPAWLATDPERPIATLAPDELQRALAASPEFQLRYHRYLLAAIERDAAAHGAALRIVTTADPSSPKAPEAVQALHRDCAAMGERCLDGRLLLGEPDVERLFLPDGHWSAEGSARIAERLADWLAPDPALAPGRKAAAPVTLRASLHPRSRTDSFRLSPDGGRSSAG